MRKSIRPVTPAILAALAVAAILVLAAAEAARAVPTPGPDPTAPLPKASADGDLPRTPYSTQAVPDIVGPGLCVSSAGNVWIKTTNIGVMGNPFLQSADPSGQWPGPSGIQYMGFWNLWVGARNPEAADPSLVHRVTHGFEWRPPSLAPEDRIYSAFEGQARGQRDFDDDGDGRRDEEFLNGKDDDGDGSIDEDFAAVSQQMCTCELRDDTEQAVNAAAAEKHEPFHLYVRQTTYAFSVPGANNFVGVTYDIQNQSGHDLDSVYVGFFVDGDIGPAAEDLFFNDDLVEPRIPSGDYIETVPPSDPRYDEFLCPVDTIHVNGFTFIDDDGDMNRTPGAGTFLLLGHTTDPTGVKAPRKVGFRMYRTYIPGTPFVQGGQPTVDLERYATLSATFGVDPTTGFINEERTDQATKTDYRSICSVGPFLEYKSGDFISVSVALSVGRMDLTRPYDDPADPTKGDPRRYENVVRAAIEAEKTFRGGSVLASNGDPSPDLIGRESSVIAPPGTVLELADCRDPEGSTRTVNDREYTWFDFDCNFCTGQVGRVQRAWLAAAPPPSPNLRLTPRDRRVTIEWDNQSETTADPSSGLFDIKSYRVWRAANYTRPVGSTGPGDELWALLAEYKVYDEYRPLVDSTDTNGDGRFDGLVRQPPLLLNVQNGQRLYPQPVDPLTDPETGEVLYGVGDRPYLGPGGRPEVALNVHMTKYPIGRYRFEDSNVLNGFMYFYSVTAVDSTGQRDVNGNRGTLAEQEGRHSATLAQGISPQGAAKSGSEAVYVVPNPYRGNAQWDLTPSAADPTGTHVDFFNMPVGQWTLRIFTISGDLVQTLHYNDVMTSGKPQQETPDDGQAAWDLISRNGQDVASGIYLFSVDVEGSASQQGKFVIIR